MINLKKISSSDSRLTIATPRLAESESRRVVDYEYLREFEAKTGMARDVM